MLADAKPETGCVAVKAAERAAAAAEAHGVADPAAVYAEAERLVESTRAPSEHVRRRHEAGRDRLKLHAMCVRSQALARLINEAVALKDQVHGIGELHSAAEYTVRHLAEAGAPEAILEYAAEVEHKRDLDYQAGLRDLDAIAEKIAFAPIADPEDALARADCIGRIIDCDDDGIPDCDADVILALKSLRAAVVDLAEARRGPDHEAWGEALCDYQTTSRELETLNRMVDDQYGAVLRWEEKDPHLHAQVDAKHREWADAQSRLLSLEPPDVDGLLTLIEIIAGHGLAGDLRSYSDRARRAGEKPPTYEDLTRPDEIGRAVAWVAIRAAQIRDRQMPSDWREFMQSRFMHPNAADAIHRAYDAGVGLHELSRIQLQGLPEDQLPVLVFTDEMRIYNIRPDASFSQVIGASEQERWS